MHYAVHYEPEQNGKYPTSARPAYKHSSLRFLGIILAVLLFTGALCFKEELTTWLIPGNDEITVQAVKELLTDIRAGEPIGKAVNVFCEEIIQNGA